MCVSRRNWGAEPDNLQSEVTRYVTAFNWLPLLLFPVMCGRPFAGKAVET